MFSLDTSNMMWYPSDDVMLGTELHTGGVSFVMEHIPSYNKRLDSVESEIVQLITLHDNIDYTICSDVIYSLISDVKQHFLTYLSKSDTEKVMRDRKRTIANKIYEQMSEHFYREETSYRAEDMYPFTRIEPSFGGMFITDDIIDLRTPLDASLVKSKVFNGFKKACHTLYKFDSNLERTFAIILEDNDETVKRWLRPAPSQFKIWWGTTLSSKYEPDFIIETDDMIFMCETKARNRMEDADVIAKKGAAEEYCRAATVFNAKNGGKPWKYLLISDDEIRRQSSFQYIVRQTLKK